MTPYECYVDYLALKRHFTTESYDYFKYNGKVKVNKDSFEKRKDKFFFERLSRHRDPHGLIVANLLQSNNIWIRDLVSDKAQEAYNGWVRKLQSITRLVESELNNLEEDFNANFIVLKGNHPPILKLYLSGNISFETLIILTSITGCISYWDKHMGDDILWGEIRIKIIKTKPFVQYDHKKIKNLIMENFK